MYDRYMDARGSYAKPMDRDEVPTIRIAGRDITMNDMFTKPEQVKQLKELQEVIDNVMSQMNEIHRKGMRPTAIIMDRKTEHLIMAHSLNGWYVPRHMAMSQTQESDRFMGLDIALNHSQRDTQYIRVCV